MHITIGTSPQADLNLSNDIKLVRAGILYADTTRLCSPAYSIVLPMLEIGNRTPEEQLDYLERVLPYSDLNDEGKEIALQEIRAERAQLSQDSLIPRLFSRIKVKKRLDAKWEVLKQAYAQLNQEVAVEEFSKAIKANLLEIQTFDTLEKADIANRGFYSDLEKTTKSLVAEFVEVLGKTVLDGSTYPLFDDSIRNEIKKRIELGSIEPSSLRIDQSKQIRLASDLLKRLPMLDEVPIFEIIDIRQELQRPLLRFRSAIIDYAEDIKSAQWDRDFQTEAEQLFTRKIGPAILEIEDAIESNSSIAGLLLSKVNAAALTSGGVMSMVLGPFLGMSSYAAFAIGGIFTTSAILHQTYKEWQKQKLGVEKNQLYFYYQLMDRLS